MAQAVGQTLYSRIGGYDVIAAYLDTVLGLVVGDPQLGPYFRGMSTDTGRRTRQLILDWLVETAGGPAIFTGRPLRVSHEGMGITEGEYAVFLAHAGTALDSVGVPGRAKEELLALLASPPVQGEIVEPQNSTGRSSGA